MKALLYLIGAPGVGKSSLMAELTAGCARYERLTPLPHDVLLDPDGVPVAAELGRRRERFSGTDALAMNVSPAACAWLRDGNPWAELVLAEGDRLAHAGFLRAAADGGYVVTLAHLTADQDTLDRRCAERGSAQSPTWRRGRTTKAANLAARFPALTLTLDAAHESPAELAAILRAAVPALAALPEGSHDVIGAF